MHHLVKDFLNVTEQAAIATTPWIGRRNKNKADEAATSAMREHLNDMNIRGVVAIGEGEIDEAPMLYIGEKLGTGVGEELDIAVDPIDGTTPVSLGNDHGITVIATAPKGTLLHAPDMYMEKLIVGKEAVGKVDIEAPLKHNLQAVAKAKGKNLNELQVVIQDRPRHEKAIDEMRELGATVHLFKDGDVLQSLKPCMNEQTIDMFYNIGGGPEGVLSAVAVRCLGGEMQAKLSFRTEEEYDRCLQMGIQQPKAALRHHHLVNSNKGIFIATAVTNTVFMNGIQLGNQGVQTESLVIESNKQSQVIETLHAAEKQEMMA